MEDLLDLNIGGTLGDRNCDGCGFERHEEHQLVVRIRLEQIVRTCDVCAVKAVDLAHEREYELVLDQALLVEFICYI